MEIVNLQLIIFFIKKDKKNILGKKENMSNLFEANDIDLKISNTKFNDFWKRKLLLD